MRSKYVLGILWIITIVLFIVFWCMKSSPITTDNTQQLLERIDSLNLEVEKLRIENTRLVSEIDSSEQKVQVIEKWYEKESGIILGQSTDSDIVFFRDYLSSVTE